MARIYVSGQAVYGCVGGSRRSYKLGSSGRAVGQSRADPVALGGRIAAYGSTSCGVDTCSAEVLVRDLRTGHQLHGDPATKSTVGPESFESVDAVVVKADGAVAWTSSAGSIIRQGSKVLEVLKHDRHGQALLDSGSGIDARSLKLRGSRLSWRDGGQTRTASLS